MSLSRKLFPLAMLGACAFLSLPVQAQNLSTSCVTRTNGGLTDPNKPFPPHSRLIHFDNHCGVCANIEFITVHDGVPKGGFIGHSMFSNVPAGQRRTGTLYVNGTGTWELRVTEVKQCASPSSQNNAPPSGQSPQDRVPAYRSPPPAPPPRVARPVIAPPDQQPSGAVNGGSITHNGTLPQAFVFCMGEEASGCPPNLPFMGCPQSTGIGAPTMAVNVCEAAGMDAGTYRPIRSRSGGQCGYTRYSVMCHFR